MSASGERLLGGADFSIEDAEFVIKRSFDDWLAMPWSIRQDIDGPYLESVNLASGTIVHARALSSSTWDLSVWWAFPRGEIAVLALEVLASSHPPYLRKTIEVAQPDNYRAPTRLLGEAPAPQDPNWTPSRVRANSALLRLGDAFSDMTKEVYLECLKAVIPELRVDYAEGALPFQSEGSMFGYNYYFRYRSGKASLSVGEDAVSHPFWLAAEPFGGTHAGSLIYPDFALLLHSLVRQLSRAPRLYEFPVLEASGGAIVRLEGDRTLSSSTLSAASWGLSEREAYESARLPQLLPGSAEDYVISPHATENYSVDFPEEEPDFAGIADLPSSQVSLQAQ